MREIFGYTLTLSGTLLGFILIAWIITKCIAADRMKQKARKVIDHIDIKVQEE